VDNVGWLVTVTVPADAGVVQLLRTIVAGVGARVGLTYDSIDDLRLAAQEAVGQIMLVTGTDGSISMRVETNERGLELRLWTERVVGAWPPPGIDGSLAWTILSTLVSDVSLDREDGAASVRLVKPLDDAGGDDSKGAA
jgi:anti-sigma regulatory factor (Ser/Thr protein kinase)